MVRRQAEFRMIWKTNSRLCQRPGVGNSKHQHLPHPMPVTREWPVRRPGGRKPLNSSPWLATGPFSSVRNRVNTHLPQKTVVNQINVGSTWVWWGHREDTLQTWSFTDTNPANRNTCPGRTNKPETVTHDRDHQETNPCSLLGSHSRILKKEMTWWTTSLKIQVKTSVLPMVLLSDLSKIKKLLWAVALGLSHCCHRGRLSVSKERQRWKPQASSPSL